MTSERERARDRLDDAAATFSESFTVNYIQIYAAKCHEWNLKNVWIRIIHGKVSANMRAYLCQPVTHSWPFIAIFTFYHLAWPLRSSHWARLMAEVYDDDLADAEEVAFALQH